MVAFQIGEVHHLAESVDLRLWYDNGSASFFDLGGSGVARGIDAASHRGAL